MTGYSDPRGHMWLPTDIEAFAQMTENRRCWDFVVKGSLIKDELEAGDSPGIEHYRKAGEMLLEAKEQVGHGEWQGWIDRNFHLSATSARRYMQLVEVTQNNRRRSFSTMSEALEPRRQHHQTSWQQPVQQIAARVNVEALAKEQQNREREAALLHKLGHQLIDIGYKVLSSKLHPDKGGSSEAMASARRSRPTAEPARKPAFGAVFLPGRRKMTA